MGIDGAGDSNIEGFATDISVNHGSPVSFKINTNSTDYRIDIYRLGYYGGLGARKVDTITHTGLQTQPDPLVDPTTGLVDAGNWSVSATWNVPADAVSGVYIAKLTRLDGTAGENQIPFIVRDDSATATWSSRPATRLGRPTTAGASLISTAARDLPPVRVPGAPMR